jgi:hypothetical protein
MLQTCSNNAYIDYVKCDYGCFNGACGDCKPGTKVCADVNSYRFCTVDGQLSEAQSCPNGYTCENDGQCIETPVCSEGQENCVSDSVYTCTNNTWKLFYHCPQDTNCKEQSGVASCVSETQVSPQPSGKPDVKPQPSVSNGFSSMELALLGLVVVFAIAATYFYVTRKK